MGTSNLSYMNTNCNTYSKITYTLKFNVNYFITTQQKTPISNAQSTNSVKKTNCNCNNNKNKSEGKIMNID